MTPERADELYAALSVLREFKREAAVVAPLATMVSPIAGKMAEVTVEFEPAAESILSLFFEVVSALESTASPEEAREKLAERLRADAQAELDSHFRGG
jgi:hypothetical protein